MPFTSTSSYSAQLAEALTRRRYGSTITPLSSVLSLDDLIDANFCRIVSEELAKDERGWEVQNATWDLWQILPESPGLYMFVLNPHLSLKRAKPEVSTNLPRVLYVGKAGSVDGNGNLRARYRSEYSNYVCRDPEKLWEDVSSADRESMLRKYLNLAPLQYWYLEVVERDTITRLETSLIKLLNPPLNFQGSKKMRPIGQPVSAF